MTQTVETRAPRSVLVVACVVSLLAVVILACIFAETPAVHDRLVSGIEVAGRFLGLVVALAGALKMYDLTSARTTEDVIRTLSGAAVPMLVGTTLVSAPAWGAPVGAGLVMVAMALTHRQACASPKQSSD